MGRNVATDFWLKFNQFVVDRETQNPKIEKGALPKIGAIFNKNTTVCVRDAGV
jgi:hypothetical protein